MVDMDKQTKVQPIYDGLIGILGNAPTQGLISKEVWTLYNWHITKLEQATNASYEEFKAIAGDYDDGGVPPNIFRPTLNSLINYLHGEYFPNDPLPFSGTPALSVHNNNLQHQSQSTTVTIQQFTQLIDKKLPFYEEESKERSFLEKLKGTISNAKDASEIITTVLALAQTYGLGIEALGKIFS